LKHLAILSFAAADILSKPDIVSPKNDKSYLCYSEEFIFYALINSTLTYI